MILRSILAGLVVLLGLLHSVRSLAADVFSTVPLLSENGKPGEVVLEGLLSPGEFMGRLFTYSSKGDEAAFCLDSSLSAQKPFALLHPNRINWPSVAGLPLQVIGEAHRLSPAEKGVTDDALDQGFSIRWTLQPLGQSFGSESVFKIKVVGAEVISAVDGRTLMQWHQPPPPEVCTLNPNLGEPSCDLAGVGREVKALALSPEGDWIALAHGGLRPRIEIIETDSKLTKKWEALFPTASGGVVEVAFSANGRWVVALTGDGSMHRFEANTGGLHMSIPSHGRTARSMPPGHIMAVAGDSGEVTLWYLSDGTIAWHLPPRKQRGPVDKITPSGDGNRFATLEYDETKTLVRVWEVKRRAMLMQIEVDRYAISDIALDTNGENLFLTHEKRGLLRAKVIKNNSTPSGFGEDVGARCKGSLQWIESMHQLICNSKEGILKIGEKGELKELLKTRVESSDWIVATALHGSKIAAVGSGHLIIWKRGEK